MSLVAKRVERVFQMLVILPALGFGLTPVWAEENQPTVDTINFYGLRTVTEQQLRAALGIKEGEPAPVVGDLKEVAKRLEKVPQVARAKLNPVTIPGGKIALFVGIQEMGAPNFQYRPAPKGSVVLPKEMVEAEAQLKNAWDTSVRTGSRINEDDSQGHALSENPEVRAGQEKFIQLATSGSDILRDVLKNSAEARQRAIAAWILGYAADKRLVIGDLMDAVRDPDPIVRNNATRTVSTIAVLASRRPELGIQIDAARFIEMLNSLDWTDRNKAMAVLGSLTKNRPPELMASLQKQALPSLREMVRWKTQHAYGSFLLLARLIDWDEKDIPQAWVERDKRENIIAKAARLPAP